MIDIPSYLLKVQHRTGFIHWLAGQILPVHTKRELARIWKDETDGSFTKEDWLTMLDEKTTFNGSSTQ